jgi:hypothetical protein
MSADQTETARIEKQPMRTLLKECKSKGGGFQLEMLVRGVMHAIVDEGPKTVTALAAMFLELGSVWANEKQKRTMTLGGFEKITQLVLDQLAPIGQVKQQEDGKWTVGDKFRFRRPFQVFQSSDTYRITIKTKRMRRRE